MANASATKKMYVRATPEARHALKTLLVALQSPSLLPDLTQEEFVTASWLWMSRMPLGDVVDGVRAHVHAIREALADGPQVLPSAPPAPAPGTVGDVCDPATGDPVRDAPRRRRHA